MTDFKRAGLKARINELEMEIKRARRLIRLFTQMGHTTHAVFENKRLKAARDALVKAETALAVHEIETHPTVLPYMGAR